MHDQKVQKQLTEMRSMIEEFSHMFRKMVTDVENLNKKVNDKIHRSRPVSPDVPKTLPSSQPQQQVPQNKRSHSNVASSSSDHTESDIENESLIRENQQVNSTLKSIGSKLDNMLSYVGLGKPSSDDFDEGELSDEEMAEQEDLETNNQEDLTF